MITYTEAVNAISSFIAWWKSPWAKAFVFLLSTFIIYLPISTVIYTQISMWVKDKANRTILYISLLLSVLASMTLSAYVIIGIQAVIKWYTTPMGPPLPYVVAALAYQPFWVSVFAVTIIIVCTPIWWAAISLSKIDKMFTIYVASKFRATSISNERAKKE